MKTIQQNNQDTLLQSYTGMKSKSTKSSLMIATLTTMSILLTSVCPNNAFAKGNGGTGGGVGIITANGSIKLLEMATESDLKSAFKNDVFSNYFPVIQNKLGEKAERFFRCSSARLDGFKFEYPALEVISNIDSEVQPLFVNFRLALLNNYEAAAEVTGLPAGSSPSMASDTIKQEPLASYVKGRLWIAGPLYKKMDTESKCALQIHESLRHLNYKNRLQDVLTTHDIEQLTQFFMGKIDDTKVSALNLLKSVKPEVTLKTSEDYLKIANEFFEKHKQCSFQLSEMMTIQTVTSNEKKQLYRKCGVYIQEGYRFQIIGFSNTGEALRTDIDAINITADLIEIIISEMVGPWNTRTLEKTK